MLAKLSDDLPRDGDYLYEPKWDGFRAIVFRGGSELFIQSRDSRPFDRYFPDLHEALLDRLPGGCVVDGEIVIATPDGLDFDALQMRLHPAASRVKLLAEQTPASYVVWDLLAIGDEDLRETPLEIRRKRLEEVIGAGVHLSPMTLDRAVARLGRDVDVNYIAAFRKWVLRILMLLAILTAAQGLWALAGGEAA